ncbi:MAG: universal stress protein [Cryomorphaceae bacterium]|nr:MAG: universal stress protein [Cryomorphaceae bacterium]
MSAQGIIIPTDFSVSDSTAILQAVHIARKTGDMITLLHIADSDTTDAERKRMESICEEISGDHGVRVGYIIERGHDPMDDLVRVLQSHSPRMLVMGTEGIRGIAQHLFGARILGILRNVSVPSAIVQDETPVTESYRKILLPIDDIEPFEEKVKSVIPFAKWFNGEVMLYALHHPMMDERKVKAHIALSRKMLDEADIRYSETEESPTVFSAGVAKQTLKFAHSWGADLIAISLNDNDNKGNINQADCERVINNDHHIAVLCTPKKLDSKKLFG